MGNAVHGSRSKTSESMACHHFVSLHGYSCKCYRCCLYHLLSSSRSLATQEGTRCTVCCPPCSQALLLLLGAFVVRRVVVVVTSCMGQASGIGGQGSCFGPSLQSFMKELCLRPLEKLQESQPRMFRLSALWVLEQVVGLLSLWD